MTRSRGVIDSVGDRVAHPQAGEIGPHRGVPFELALVDQGAHHEGRERLGARADGEERMGRDGQLVLDVALAKPAGVDDLAVLDDGHGQARDLPLLPRIVHERFEPCQRGLCLGDRDVAG